MWFDDHRLGRTTPRMAKCNAPMTWAVHGSGTVRDATRFCHEDVRPNHTTSKRQHWPIVSSNCFRLPLPTTQTFRPIHRVWTNRAWRWKAIHACDVENRSSHLLGIPFRVRKLKSLRWNRMFEKCNFNSKFLPAFPCIHRSSQCACVWIQVHGIEDHRNHRDNVVGILRNPTTRSRFCWCIPTIGWNFEESCTLWKCRTFRLGSLSSGHSEIQTQEAVEPSALQTRPAPQWILMHGSTARVGKAVFSSENAFFSNKIYLLRD